MIIMYLASVPRFQKYPHLYHSLNLSIYDIKKIKIFFIEFQSEFSIFIFYELPTYVS
jgi:hypothetical protein